MKDAFLAMILAFMFLWLAGLTAGLESLWKDAVRYSAITSGPILELGR